MSLLLVSEKNLYNYMAAADAFWPDWDGLELNNAGQFSGCYVTMVDKLVDRGYGDHITTNRYVYLAVDPDYFDYTATGMIVYDWYQYTLGSVTAVNVGDPNKAGGQKVYIRKPISPFELFQMNPTNFTQEDPDVFPNHKDVSSLTSTDPGYFTGPALSVIYFEGLTDGIPGYTELVGTNVYPLGLCLRYAQGVYGVMHGETSYDNTARRICWFNLNTGHVTGDDEALMGHSGDTKFSHEGPYNGDTIDWNRLQYVPDDDATVAAPKGLLITMSTVPYVSGGTPSNPEYCYVRAYDFNPFGVAAATGEPERVHGRVRYTSRLEFPENPWSAIEGGGWPTQSFTGYYPHYHPPSRTFRLHRGYNAGAVPTDKTNLAMKWSQAAELDAIMAPTFIRVPRTADIVECRTRALGDLGEKIAGLPATFTLTGASSFEEVIPAGERTFPGTSQLDHYPIDMDDAGSTEGTLVLVADGTPLVQGTDYTVNLSTGLITWVLDHSGDTLVTATYEHREDPTADPFGTLLSSTGQTDEDGFATTRIQYADDDDLVGQIDYLEVEITQ